MTETTAVQDQLPADLDLRLKALKAKRKAYEIDAVDANIAELEKLVAERDKVIEAYGKVHDDLAKRQSILEKFKQTVEPDFKDCLLPDGGTEKVDKIVQDRLKAINDAHLRVDRIRGDAADADAALEPEGIVPVDTASTRLDQATRAFEVASARLEQLRALPKSAETRLKALEKLQEEINALKAAGENATAYWLLTGRALVDDKGHVVLPGDQMFSDLLKTCPADPDAIGEGETLSSCPAIIPKGQVAAQLQTAFVRFQAKRRAADAAAETLVASQTALKEAEKTLADLKKNLVTTIRNWLDAYPDAPDGAAE